MLRVHVAASHVRSVVEQLLTPEFKQRELVISFKTRPLK
jgi:hypothetical protein